MPYTAIVGEIGLQNQTSIVQLQKYFPSSLPCFPTNCSKCCCTDTLICKNVPHVENTLQYINTYAYVFLKGKLEGVLKSAPLCYKTTWSESRKIDCQWSLASFILKLNQFSREARLTCPLIRPKEDIIHVHMYSRVVTSSERVEHLAKKVCQCNNISNNLWRNKED